MATEQKRGRGRPPMDPGEKHSAEIKIRLTVDEMGALDRYCADHGSTRAAAARELVCSSLRDGGYLEK